MTGIVKLDEIQNNAGTTTLAKLENGQLTGVLSPATGFRNRIINGDMRIDQRNAGASVTPAAGGFIYTLDRFSAYQSQASKFSVQRDTVAPSGFINSLKVTSLSAYSVAAGDLFMITQPIEGFNIADLGWGTANAQAITLSFWVRSSLTGTFGGSLLNGSADRSYPFTYTVSSANTWEYKTITVAGDTTGTWLTTNGVGVHASFGLGMGSTFSGTAGAWAGSQFWSATGATSVVGTSGATFYLTGVSLEKGTVATPFEFRSIGQELALCKRYYQRMAAGYEGSALIGNANGAMGQFLVEMRASPTITWLSNIASNLFPTTTSSIYIGASTTNFWPFKTASGSGQDGRYHDNYAASAEL